MWSRPCARSHASAAASSAGTTSGSSSNSRKPNIPQLLSWKRLNESSYWAVMRPITRPPRRARNSCASPCLKNAFRRRLRNSRRSRRSGGTQTAELECSRYGSSMNSRRSRRDATGCTSTGFEPTRPHSICRPPSTSSRRSAATSAPSSCRPARDADLLPYFRLVESPAAPVVEMEGAERVMLGSNNYLGLTADERVLQGARDALEQYGTGPDRLAAAQRHDPAAPRPRARAGGVDGHRGGDRLHHRPPGQRGHARDAARPRRHRDRRLRRPRLDPRRLPALAREAARVPPQPARQAREDAGPRRRRRRGRARRRRRRVLDGGRRRRRCPRSSSCARPTARG